MFCVYVRLQCRAHIHIFNRAKKTMKKPAKPEEWGVSFLLTTNHKTFTDLCFDCTPTQIPYRITGWKISEEIGEAGNLHTHLYVNFERSQRRTALIKRFPHTDVKRVSAGTERTVIDYLGNQDKEEAKGCQILAVYQWGDIDTTQGTRTDLTKTDETLWQIKEAIDNGESMRHLYNTFFPAMIRYGKGIRDYHEYVKSENFEAKQYRLKEEGEHAIEEAEKIVLQAIREKNQSGIDTSTPLCPCGKPMTWDSINRVYSCFECDNPE